MNTAHAAILPHDLRVALDAPFAIDQRRQDVSRAGDDFRPTYVPGTEVIRRLNQACGHNWDLHVQHWHLSPDNRELVVHVRLTIRAWVQDPAGQWHLAESSRTQVGQSFLKAGPNGGYWDFGKDFKAAITDGLRKAASLFGVGLSLYEKDESPFQGYPQVGPDPSREVAQPFQQDQVDQFFLRLGVTKPVWSQYLGVQPGQLSVAMVQDVLQGRHPYVQQLLLQSRMAPVAGLQSREG